MTYNELLPNNKKEQTTSCWMNLKNIRLSERSPPQNRTYTLSALLYDILEQTKQIYDRKKKPQNSSCPGTGAN